MEEGQRFPYLWSFSLRLCKCTSKWSPDSWANSYYNRYRMDSVNGWNEHAFAPTMHAFGTPLNSVFHKEQTQRPHFARFFTIETRRAHMPLTPSHLLCSILITSHALLSHAFILDICRTPACCKILNPYCLTVRNLELACRTARPAMHRLVLPASLPVVLFCYPPWRLLAFPLIVCPLHSAKHTSLPHTDT